MSTHPTSAELRDKRAGLVLHGGCWLEWSATALLVIEAQEREIARLKTLLTRQPKRGRVVA